MRQLHFIFTPSKSPEFGVEWEANAAKCSKNNFMAMVKKSLLTKLLVNKDFFSINW
jgi:hypothetical protein